MNCSKIYSNPNSSIILMARLITSAGEYITQSDIDSITLTAYDLEDPYPSTYSATLSIANTIFDTLQTNSLLWDGDETGFNFKYVLPGSVLENSNTTYQIEITISPTNGEDFVIIYRIETGESFT